MRPLGFASAFAPLAFFSAKARICFAAKIRVSYLARRLRCPHKQIDKPAAQLLFEILETPQRHKGILRKCQNAAVSRFLVAAR